MIFPSWNLGQESDRREPVGDRILLDREVSDEAEDSQVVKV